MNKKNFVHMKGSISNGNFENPISFLFLSAGNALKKN